MKRVFTARPYKIGEMWCRGNARYMIIRQYNYPDTYDDDEKVYTVDSDRKSNFNEICKKHNTSEMQFDQFLEGPDHAILAFIIDLLEIDQNITWTGYRVMGTVGENGHNIWSFGIFAKNPSSTTAVYSERIAPNVEVEDPLN